MEKQYPWPSARATAVVLKVSGTPVLPLFSNLEDLMLLVEYQTGVGERILT